MGFHDSRTLHPSLQLLGCVHGHAPSSCKPEFADNVHDVDLHAHVVGAIHAPVQPLSSPLPHGTHSPMAFGDASYYPQPNAEATTHHQNAEAMAYHPSTLPLDRSPHHAWPTCHQDGPLPLHGPTQGIAMVSLWNTACFVVCPPCMCTHVLFYTAESRRFQVYAYVLQYMLHVQACARGVHMRRAPYCDAVCCVDCVWKLCGTNAIVRCHSADDGFAFPEFVMDDLLPVDLPDASLPIINAPHQSSAAASAELSLPTSNAGKTINLAVAKTVSQTAVCDVSSVLG